MINQKILNKAYRLLSRRDHAVFELKEKLIKRGFLELDIKEVITHLKDLGYLDDEMFARKYIEYKSLISPRGHLKLRMELRKKGVIPEHIESALSSEKYVESLLAEDFISRKSRYLARFPAKERTKKLWQMLKNRGFKAETIYKVMESC